MFLRCGLVFGLLAAPGCSLFTNKAATARLQTGFEMAQQRAAMAEAEVQTLTERLERVERVMRDQGLDGSTPGGSLSSVSTDVARINGAVEELQFLVKTLKDDFEQVQLSQDSRQLKDEARLAQLEQLLGVAPPSMSRVEGNKDAGSSPGGAVVDRTEPTPPPASENVPQDMAGRLALAEERMTQGLQPAARAILQAAIADAPSGDSMLPEAHYRLAETWFNESKFKEAARAFQVVTDKYAKSSWASWAMLRIGECFAGLGRAQDAKYFFEGVMAKYPGSDAALDARSKLNP
jgi:TolA-binding protein